MKTRRYVYILLFVFFGLYLFFANQIVAFFSSGCFRLDDKEFLAGEKEKPRYALDVFHTVEESFFECIALEGWTFQPTEHNNSNKQIGVILSDDERLYSYIISPNTFRGDLTAPGIRGTMHGFVCAPSTILVKDGTYRVGIYCYENEHDHGYVETDYLLVKKGVETRIEAWHSVEIELQPDTVVKSDAKAAIDSHRKEEAGTVIVNGWGFISGEDPREGKIRLLLTYADGTAEAYDTAYRFRPDLAAGFGDEMYAHAGFHAEIPAAQLHSEEYTVSVLIETEDGLHTNGKMIADVQRGLTAMESDKEESSGEESSGLTKTLAVPLTALLQLCYKLLKSYVPAIVLFTLLTKVLLLPVSLWVQRNGIKMVAMTPAINGLKIKYFGDKDAIADETQRLYKEKKYHPIVSTVPMIVQMLLLLGVIAAVRAVLAGTDSVLSRLPFDVGGAACLMPVAAGASALALGLGQNRLNPLQREQSRAEQRMTNGISIGISLALAAFVPIGVGVYWVCSNLFSILQQLVLNRIINPKKYVDYVELARSKEELAKMNSLSGNVSQADREREKEDYKRFFSVANKHLVFYSESSGFYKYYKNLIEELLRWSNVIIHYVTSDPRDQIFEIAKKQPRIRAYYIGQKRLITLFMKMDADMVVTTIGDLENYHLKRSYVRKDVEYVYTCHYPLSTHMVLHTGFLDHYDTVLCVGKFQFDEIRFCENLHSTPEKKLIDCGYSLLEDLQKQYDAMELTPRERKKILIAPSWQTDNILDSCIDAVLEQLLGRGYQVVVRPHPEYMKRYRPRMDAIVARYADYTGGDLSFELDFTDSKSIFDSDLVITDWSGTAYEFAFVTKKPAAFINTPPKIHNSEYDLYPMPALERTLRSQVGAEFEPNELHKLAAGVEELLSRQDQYREKISRILENTISNFGSSARVGAKYILRSLMEKDKRRNRAALSDADQG